MHGSYSNFLKNCKRVFVVGFFDQHLKQDHALQLAAMTRKSLLSNNSSPSSPFHAVHLLGRLFGRMSHSGLSCFPPHGTVSLVPLPSVFPISM